jgi:hypothetical protein
VQATFSNQLVAQFNVPAFKQIVAELVSSHCRDSGSCQLSSTNRNRRATFDVTAEDVIILSISQVESDVVVAFYVNSPDETSVISASAIVEALQSDNAQSSFARFGLVLAQVSVVHPSPTTSPTTDVPIRTKDTGLSTAEIVGIAVAAVGSAILFILLIIFLIRYKKQGAKVKPTSKRETIEMPPIRKSPPGESEESTSPELD